MHCTFCKRGYGWGEIIDQKIVNISTHDDEDSLSKKILMEEHKLYIKVLKNWRKLWKK